jgi:hypothetical protein
MLRMAECAAIVNELDKVDWFGLFYEIVWSCFERHVPMRFSRGGRKLPWITDELSCLKNKKTKAAKRLKACEKRCLEVKTIDNCECEHLQGELLSLREENQLMHGREYDDFCVGIEEAIKSDTKTFFWLYGFDEEECCGYPSVMHFDIAESIGSHLTILQPILIHKRALDLQKQKVCIKN